MFLIPAGIMEVAHVKRGDLLTICIYCKKKCLKKLYTISYWAFVERKLPLSRLKEKK